MKYCKELKHTVDIKTLEKEVNELLIVHQLHLNDRQLCLTHPIECADPWYHGVGSAYYETDNVDSSSINSNEFLTSHQRKRAIPLTEEAFTEINKELEGTYIYNLCKIFKTEYNLGRIRIITLLKKTCLTWHADTENRIHIPVITNKKCRMVIEEECFHMESGKSYLVNTRNNHHTAFNGSNIERIHIVGNIIC